jgi:hypothetical protein
MQRRIVPRRIATAVLTSMSLVLAFAVQRPALATATDEMPIENFVLDGAGPTLWDGNNSSGGCDLSGFAPVDDGQWKERSDAFDGGAVLGVDGSGFDDPNDLSPFGTNTYSTGPSDLGTTRVWRTDRALQKSSTLQSLITLRNTDSSSGHTITVEWDSNLGSDGFESVHGSSSGDTNYALGDRWVVSSDSSQSDPVLTFVLFGRHAAEQTDTIVNAPGSGCMTATFSVHLAAGATKYMLFFTEMNGSNKQARKSAGKFDSVAAGDPILKGISTKVQHKIANWDL